MSNPIVPLDGPGCGHEICILERDCLVVQAEAELEACRADRAHRHHVALLLCRYFGLPENVAAVAEVAFYSGSIETRIRAGELLADELQAVAA